MENVTEKQPILRSCLATRIKNIDGKIMGKDGKPMRTATRNVHFHNDKDESLVHGASSDPVQDVDSRSVSDSATHDGSSQDKPIENPNFVSLNTSYFVDVLNSNKESRKLKFKALLNPEQVANADFVLPLATLTAAQQRYANSLIGYFVRKNVAFPLVQNYVTNTWGKFRFQKVIKDEDDFFFKFVSLAGLEQVLEQVLEQGPWLIRNMHMILTKWSPNMSLTKDKVTKVPVWVKLHKVPIVAYSEDGLSLIATQIGQAVMLDTFTSTISGWSGTYECRISPLGYELKPPFHFAMNAMWLGHNMDQCPILVVDKLKGSCGSGEMIAHTMETEKENIDLFKLKNQFDSLRSQDDTIVDTKVGESCMMNEVTANRDTDSESEVEEIEVNGKPKGASTPSFDGCRIILGWNLDIVNVVVISQSSQVMHVKIVHKASGKQLFCSFVYASNSPSTRRILWAELGMHKLVTRGVPWTLMGDFNVALNLEDYSSSSSKLSSTISEFKDYVYNIEVLDITSSGLHFTWNQKPKGEGGLLKKLDRVLGNTDFIDAFLGSYALFQPYRISDHSPAVLHIPNLPFSKPKPFKIFNFLTHKSQFKEVVSNTWNKDVEGHKMFQVVSKLRSLKKPFLKLLQDHGNLHDRVNKLRVELDTVQKALDLNPNDVNLRDEEAVYVQAFTEAKIDEERFLKQKAKIEWLDVGDSNSAYFHKSVKCLNQRSRVDIILNLANVEVTRTDVANAFVSHYENFLGSDMVCDMVNSDRLFVKQVSENSYSNMVSPITYEEIKSSMFSIGDDRAPGPDDFSLLKEINHTFLALIPKVPTPLKVTDFQPISCCNVIYKCISKILTNHIIKGVKVVVSDNQSAFVPGRRISDNILITQELMHNYHQNRGPPRCAFMIDIQKAYDTVNKARVTCLLDTADTYTFVYHRLLDPTEPSEGENEGAQMTTYTCQFLRTRSHQFPDEEQPLPHVDSPTAESPGHVTESDPEEDPEVSNQIQTLRIASTQALINAVTAALPSPPLPPSILYMTTTCITIVYEVGESSTARPSRGRGIDYEFVSMVDSEERQQELEILRVRIRDTRNNRSRISQLVDMTRKRVESTYGGYDDPPGDSMDGSSDTATAVEFSHSDITSDESWHLRPEEDTGPAQRSYTRHTGATSRGAHIGGADGPKI
ncbi:hypothetical protein Tco_0320427 [Tanacetum coccineum]